MADETRKDYVAEAYETFIKNAADLDPSDPVAAIQAYFDKNASDDLKARVKADGKTAKGCWTFIEAVARKALHGHSGHIDPAAIYAIAMHWFEDVPKDWNGTPAKPEPNPQTAKAKPKKPAETPSEIRKEKAKAKTKAAKPKPKRPKFQQGFFFDILEVAETEKAETETEKAETETEKAETETEKAETETKKAETETKQANAETEAANAD